MTIAAAHELIKPSSPTPQHKRNLQLSFLDQLSPPFHIHIILYFQSSHAPDLTTSSSLKRSLSDALALYYPLAGRFTRNQTRIDCNDSGAEYIEARFPHHRISDIMDDPTVDDLQKYVPAAPSGGLDVPLAVQASFFGCGGISVGICMSHRVADAMSMVMFVNAWAAACRLETLVCPPVFGSASRFPPADFSVLFEKDSPPPPPPAQPPQKVVTKRFVFDERKLAAVRKASVGLTMKAPTRVEAVSAFIWSHLIESTGEKDSKVFMAGHAVDIRARASPPFPSQFFGNACARAMTLPTTSEEKRDYYDLAMKLRGAIRESNAAYVTRLEDGDTFLKHQSCKDENDPSIKEAGKVPEICFFSSWCRLPAYEADFGWGEPVWVSIIPVHFKNMIIFTGTKSGDGIEAWVSGVEEDISSFDNSFQLL